MPQPTSKPLSGPWLRTSLLVGAGIVFGVGLVFLSRRESEDDGSVITPRLGALPVSTISVPVLYSPDQLFEQLERQIPLLLGGLADRQQYPSYPLLQYAFEAEREPFDVEIRGDTVRLTTIVRYGGQVWYSTPFGVELTASCGISERTTGMGGLRAVVGFSSPIQIEEQWTLRSNVTVDRVEPVAPDDRCVLSVFQFELDATEPIMAEVRRRLEFEATRIDSVLATVELRRSLEEPWSLAQEPIRLAPDTWLSLTPLGLGYRVDPEPGPGSRQLRGHLEVAAQPQVILGRRPENPSRPLPPLGPVTSGGDPWVLIDGRAEYLVLSELASAAVTGQTFRFAGRTIEIRSVELSGSTQGQITAELEVGGELQAGIRLTGTPVLNAEEITFPDLQFSIETDDRLARVTAWLLRIGLPNYARRRVSISTGEALAWGRASLGELDLQLSGGTRLQAELGAIEIVGLAASSDALIVRSRARPEAFLQLKPDDFALSRASRVP